MKQKQLIHLISAFIILSNLLFSNAHAERKTTYFHTDAQGSVVAASDENGELLWRKQYQPFGLQLDGSNTSEQTSFTGKQHDSDTGLTYFGARYYDPVIGRFISTDPVSPLAGASKSSYFFNRYAYAYNNPYRYVDPDGNLPVLVPLAIFVSKEIAAAAASKATGGLSDYASVGGLVKKVGKKVLAKKLRDGNTVDGATNMVDLNLKYKEGWTSAQRAAADAKCQSLCDADTVVTQVNRSGTSASSRYKRAGNTVSSGNDVDHVVDLQLGGTDSVSNMLPLDSSVNRSLGSQIHHQIKKLPAGTVIDKVNIE